MKNMKQAMKRFGAMLLTMAMLLSLAVTGVSAEEAASTASDTVKITVKGLSDNDTLEAYRVIKYNEGANAFESAYSVKEGETSFWSYLDSLNKQATPQAVDPAEYLQNVAKNDSDELRTLLKNFLADPTHALPAKADYTADVNGVLDSVVPGYYIIKVTSNSNIYDTMLLFVGYKNGSLTAKMGDANLTLDEGKTNEYTATMKSEEGPKVEKKVFDDRGFDTADALTAALKDAKNWKSAAASEVGQVVKFFVKVTLPTYQNDADVTLTLKDTLTNMEYTGGEFPSGAPSINAFTGVKVYDVNKDEIPGAVTEVTPGTYQDGRQEMNIELNYATLKSTTEDNAVFYVYYEATLREDAVTGENHQGTNDVILNYTVETSAGKYTGAPKADEVTVYTYNFKLDKTYDKSTDANKHTSDAVFSVYAAANDTDVETNKVMHFKKAADGKYYYPVASNVDGATDKISADFEIRGLDVNTEYYVKEVETPAGYYAPNGYFTLKLSGEESADGTVLGELKNEYNETKPYAFVAKKGKVDQVLVTNGNGDEVNGRYGEISKTKGYEYDVTLNNSSTPVLPSTGGMGTTLFTVGGVALLALAAAMLILRRRKN